MPNAEIKEEKPSGEKETEAKQDKKQTTETPDVSEDCIDKVDEESPVTSTETVATSQSTPANLDEPKGAITSTSAEPQGATVAKEAEGQKEGESVEEYLNRLLDIDGELYEIVDNAYEIR